MIERNGIVYNLILFILSAAVLLVGILITPSLSVLGWLLVAVGLTGCFIYILPRGRNFRRSSSNERDPH
jgi:hypothetical protein